MQNTYENIAFGEGVPHHDCENTIHGRLGVLDWCENTAFGHSENLSPDGLLKAQERTKHSIEIL